jgi:hypothetical protein
MLKLHESLDKTLTRSASEREEKEPGYRKLEPHKKQLILNASALPPFDSSASAPTEFYTTFLKKKSQFKAKEMLLHQLSIDNITFNPNMNFVACLWNCEFIWILPDSPSGISIFFCPEAKSLIASDLEKERNLALADKVKQTELEKLAKQKITIPTSLMDLVWMTQNLHAVVSLCFGPRSLSAKFLNNWATHMYKNRIIYTSLQGSDSSFYAKVLFTIDNALQMHWKLCCDSTDRQSVDDQVLMMNDVQNSIRRYNFTQSIPRSILDKIQESEKKLDKDDKKDGGKTPGKGKPDDDSKTVYNNDKNHKRWRLQDGRQYSKVFFPFQKNCPKTKDGKQMCMKYLIRSFCDSSVIRVHKLSPEDEASFDIFYHKCHDNKDGSQKQDF